MGICNFKIYLMQNEKIPCSNATRDFRISGVPKGSRTPVTAVKGRCPRPLDDGDAKLYLVKVARILCWRVGYVNYYIR